jgi:hypothetical protein
MESLCASVHNSNQFDFRNRGGQRVAFVGLKASAAKRASERKRTRIPRTFVLQLRIAANLSR